MLNTINLCWFYTQGSLHPVILVSVLRCRSLSVKSHDVGYQAAISLPRYYINNFLDGYRTDANRFFVGEVTADQLKECMLTSLRKENMDTSPTRNLPLFLLAVRSFLTQATNGS